MSTARIDETLLSEMLDWAYTTAVEGPNGLEPASALAESHHRPVQTSMQMADEIVGWQRGRMTVEGFFGNLASQLRVPETYPTALGTFLYLQLRIAAAIAYGGGKELDRPVVRALVFSTLLGDAQAQALAALDLPADFVATRAALKALPDDAAETLDQVSLPLIAASLQDGPLASAFDSVQAPWENEALILSLAETAKRSFIVLRHW